MGDFFYFCYRPNLFFNAIFLPYMSKSKKQPTAPETLKPVESQPKAVASAPATTPFSIPYAEPILLAIIALVYYIVRSNFFDIPMERDEGIYAYFGQLILDGKVPYVDFYESRLPGIFYLYALLVGVFGSFEGLAMAFTLVNIGSFLFFYFFAKNWFEQFKPAAFIAATTMLVLGLAPEISGFTRQSEHLVVFWLTGGLFFLQRAFASDNWKNLLTAGVFMCMAMLTKPNGIFFIVMGGLWTVAYYAFGESGSMQERVKQVIIKGLTYSAGVFGTFGVLCLFLLMQGALDDMWYWVITYSADYAARIPWAGENGQLGGKDYLMMNLSNITKNYYTFWYMGAIGAVAYLFAKPISNAIFSKIALYILLVFSFFSITPSFSFYGHYWIMLMPALALAFASLFYTIYSIAGRSSLVGWAATGAYVLLILIHANTKPFDTYYFKPNHNAIVRQTYGGNPFLEAYEVGKFIKRRAQPSDQIALIGSEPEVFIYTGLRSVSKHAYFSYLMNDTTKTKALEWQQEFQQDIETQKPRFIAFFNHDISILPSPNASFGMINKMLSEYIPQHYRVVGVVDLAGTAQPVYVLDETKAPMHQFAQAQNGQRLYTIIVYERK